MKSNRRQFLLASGVALAGAGVLSGAAGAETSDAPTAENPSSYDYPVMGTDPEAPVATVYGGFDCPYTEDMVEESFGDIIEEFVDPGRLRLRFRALEYDENGNPYISDDGVITGQATGGVWEEDPEAVWEFFAAVYEEMPGDMSEEKVERIMKDVGVDNAEYIADNLEEWDPELRETADDAYDEGVEWTPTIELKGDLGNRDNVVEWIEQRLEDEESSESSDDSDDSDESDTTEDSDTSDDSDTADDSDTSDDSDESDTADDSDDSDSSDESQGSSQSSQEESDDDSEDDSDGGNYQCSADGGDA